LRNAEIVVSGFKRPDVILPFLRPIAHLIHDPDLSEIMVHCGGVS
jgi:hypothetical protein